MNSRSRYGLINSTGVTTLFLIGAMLLALGAKAQTWQRSSTSFTVAGKTVQGVGVADLNGDGAGDMVLSVDHKALVYIGDGTGNFKLNADAGKGLAGASIQDFVLGDFSARGAIDLLALASQPPAQALQLVLYHGDVHGNFDGGTVLNDPSLPALDDSCSLTTGLLFQPHAALDDYVLFCNTSPSLVYVGVNAGNGTFSVNTQATPFRSATTNVFTADLLDKGVDGVGFFDTARIHSNPFASILYFDTPQSATVSTASFPGAQLARVARYDGEQYPGLVGVDAGVLYSQRGIEGGFGDRKTIDAVAKGVKDIAFGHLQAIPGDPALDIVLASVSDGQIQLQPYVNTARTQVVVTQGQKRQSSLSMNVKVVPFTGNTIPLAPSATDDAHALALSQESSAAVVGSVGISVDGSAPESVSVDEQGADFSTIASSGTHQTVTSFAGDDIHAASLIATPMSATTGDVFVTNVSVNGTTVTITAEDTCSVQAGTFNFTAATSGTEGASCSGVVKEGGANGDGSCSISGLKAGNYAAAIVATTDPCGAVQTTGGTPFTIGGTKTTPSISVSCSPNDVPFVASGSGALTTCTATVGATGSTANVTFTSPQIGSFSSTSALSGGKASFSGFGAGTAPASFTITASFAGDANFNATSASTTFSVIKATPSISLSCSPNPVAFVASGGGVLTTCTATVGAPGSTAAVSFSEDGNVFTAPALSNDIATASGFSPGTPVQGFTMEASFAGDGNYNTVSTTTTFSIVKATPTVAVSCLPSPATFSSSGATVATCTATVSNGATGSVTFSGTGVSANIGLSSGVASLPGFQGFAPTSETITAVYSGDGNHNAASGTGTLTIIQATQTITFTAPASPVTLGGAAIGLSASASSGLAVSFSASGACSVSGSTLTFISGGSCTVTASQSGNVDYSAAASVTDTITVNQASQTITFTAPTSPVTFGVSAIGLSASASSGLAVSFTASGACSVSGAALTFTGAGSCTVTASQAGNANFSAATPVTNTITIDAGSQTITFTQPTTPVTFGVSAIGLSASASSGLAISFSASGACSVSGSTLSITAAGTCTVTASQAGNANFSAATPVARTITVSQVSQTINFTQPTSPVTVGVDPITLSATGGGSGNPVIFSIVSGPGSLSGNTLNVTGDGTVVVAANQAGNADFAAAVQVEQSIVVNGSFATFSQVSASSNSISVGSPITLSSLVNTGGHAPTGTVTFESNGTVIGSGTVSTVSTTNLLLDSNFESGSTFWGLNPTLPIVSGAAGMLGGNAFVYTGTGAASSFEFNPSVPITVTPGATYTLSGYIDATSVTSGTPEWAVFNTAISVGIAGVTINPGTKGRISVTFVMPADISQVVFLCDTANSTVSNGGQVIFSNPQLEQASTLGPYVQTETSAATGSGGSVSSTTSSLAVGTDSIVAVFDGDGSDQASTSLAVPVTVTADTPTVTVSCSPTSAIFASSGLVDTCTANVSGGDSPTGTVTFLVSGGVGSFNLPLSSGVATLAGFAGITPGAYTITATYSGDVNNTSASASTTLTINPVSQTITFGALANQTLGAAPFAVSASASSGLPVSFASTTPSVCTVSGATVSVIAIGTCSIQATQAGNAGVTAATAVSQSFMVSQVVTVSQVSASSSSINAGSPVTLTSLVNTGGHAPTGTVSFTSNGTSIGSGTVSTATTTNVLTFSNQFGQGNWSLEATSGTGAPVLTADNQIDPFGGSAASTLAFPAVPSAGVSFIQNAAVTPAAGSVYTMSVWLKANANSTVTLQMTEANANDAIQDSINVTTSWQRFSLTSGVFDGTAELLWRILDTASSATPVFIYGAQLEEAGSVGPYVATGAASASGSGGLAKLMLSTLPVGTDSIVATYGGDTSDQGSTSLPVPVIVTPVTPTVTVACSPNPAPFAPIASDPPVTCTATVSGGATGTVSFSGSGVSAPNVPLSSGVATISGFQEFTAGTVTITATYNGDANNNPASGSIMLTIAPDSQTITFAALANQTFGVAPFAVSASASSGLPVSFASTTTGVCTVSGSTVTIVAMGTCTIQATQAGNVDFTAATAMSQSFTVSPVTTSTTLLSSVNPSQAGQSVTFTALVSMSEFQQSEAAAPTGSVSFTSGGATLGTGTVNTVSTTNLIPDSDFVNGLWTFDNTPIAGSDMPIVDGAGPGGANAFVYTGAGSPAGFNVNNTPAISVTPGDTYTLSIFIDPTQVTSGTVVAELTNMGINSFLCPIVAGVGQPAQRYSATCTIPSGMTQVLVITDPDNATVSSGGKVIWSQPQLEQASEEGPYIQTGTVAAAGFGGKATFSTSGLPAGTDPITAVYSGSTNDTGSTSTVLEQVVQQQTQTITFTAPTTPVTFGVSAIGLSATASSGLAVSFNATGPCSVSGSTLTITGAGTCTVTANQAGNADFSAAASVSNGITVNAASQTITFTAPATPVTVGINPITLSATASSGLPVAFTVLSGPGAISGRSLSITGPGTIVVAANQAGNAGFSAAPQVEQTVVVNDVQLTTPPSSVAIGVVTPYQISLIAGTSTLGAGPFGGAATSAELNGPRDAAVDASGNVYIADLTNNLVEKVSTSGVISIFAGTGTAGFSGDGGPATSAQLNSPQGIAFDAAGNVYIADRNNSVIRMVNSSGTISAFAGTTANGFAGDGGPAASAELSDPVDVAFDSAGNLYIADRGNNRIRMVSASTGIITTLAGNGTAGFAGDGGLATSAEFSNLLQDITVDSHGNVFIADAGNNRIRMVAAGTGIVSTVAGNGIAGSSGNGGPATSAELNSPFGVAVDAAGNLYLSDEANSLLRMVTTSGTITTIAGGGGGGAFAGDGGPATSASLASPSGLSISANGTIYFADLSNNTVRSLGPNGALVFSSLPVASTSAVQTVTVQNTGAATLTFSAAPTVTGDFAIASGNTCGTSGSTLASGASCSIAMTFSPTDVGTRTGLLTLADNGVATSQQVVLTGMATEDTTTTARLTSSVNPSTFGQAVVFTATVPSEATGSVQFLNGSTSLGTSPVSGGVATLSISALPVGTDSITAVYSGDSNFAGATSAAVSQVVQQAIPTISISNIPNPAVFGQSFTPTFTYSGIGSPAESVTSSTTGVCSVSGSTVSFVGVGACTLTAAASATTDDAAAVGSPQTFQVSQVATTTTLSSSLNPSTFGQSVVLTSLVNTGGTTPTGSVSFMNGGTTLGTGTVTPVSTTNLIPDSNFANGLWQFEGGSFANTTLPIVSGAGPGGANAFVITGNGSPAAFAFNNSPLISVTPGATYTLSVFIDPSAVTNGTVEAALCTEPEFNCVGGTFVVAGAGQPAQRYSAAITIPAGVTQVSVIVDPNVATVSNGGKLIFSQPQLELASQEGPYVQTGTAATTGFGGSATFSTTSLPVGTDPITAVYSGDTNDTGSTSPLLQQVVNQAMPTISIANIPSGDVVGQRFTPTFTYNGTGTPTKSVASSTPAVCVVSGGTVNFIAAGACTLTASATSTTDDTAVTGSPQSFTIGTGAVNIAAVSTLSTSTYGQIVTWTFTVTGVNGTPVVPTGNIQVVLAGTPLATVPLVNGVGIFISGTLPGGKDTMTTIYSGDSNFH
jgi:Bacterial Ig-like domain (group 3)/NHL repeat